MAFAIVNSSVRSVIFILLLLLSGVEGFRVNHFPLCGAHSNRWRWFAHAHSEPPTQPHAHPRKDAGSAALTQRELTEHARRRLHSVGEQLWLGEYARTHWDGPVRTHTAEERETLERERDALLARIPLAVLHTQRAIAQALNLSLAAQALTSLSARSQHTLPLSLRHTNLIATLARRGEFLSLSRGQGAATHTVAALSPHHTALVHTPRLSVVRETEIERVIDSHRETHTITDTLTESLSHNKQEGRERDFVRQFQHVSFSPTHRFLTTIETLFDARSHTPMYFRLLVYDVQRDPSLFGTLSSQPHNLPHRQPHTRSHMFSHSVHTQRETFAHVLPVLDSGLIKASIYPFVPFFSPLEDSLFLLTTDTDTDTNANANTNTDIDKDTNAQRESESPVVRMRLLYFPLKEFLSLMPALPLGVLTEETLRYTENERTIFTHLFVRAKLTEWLSSHALYNNTYEKSGYTHTERVAPITERVSAKDCVGSPLLYAVPHTDSVREDLKFISFTKNSPHNASLVVHTQRWFENGTVEDEVLVMERIESLALSLSPFRFLSDSHTSVPTPIRSLSFDDDLSVSDSSIETETETETEAETENALEEGKDFHWRALVRSHSVSPAVRWHAPLAHCSGGGDSVLCVDGHNIVSIPLIPYATNEQDTVGVDRRENEKIVWPLSERTHTVHFVVSPDHSRLVVLETLSVEGKDTSALEEKVPNNEVSEPHTISFLDINVEANREEVSATAVNYTHSQSHQVASNTIIDAHNDTNTNYVDANTFTSSQGRQWRTPHEDERCLTLLSGPDMLNAASPSRGEEISVPLAFSQQVRAFWFSPDSHKLLCLCENERESETIFSWTVFDFSIQQWTEYDEFLPTSQFLHSHIPFFDQLSLNFNPWSPDSQSFLYVDRDRGLVHVPLSSSSLSEDIAPLGRDRWQSPDVSFATWSRD